eukprot:7766712-Pyramimonas_sp.AAC.1
MVQTAEGTALVCGKRFTTIQALLGHRREYHNIRPVVASLVATNQCPWCLSTFADKRTAIDHATRAADGHGIRHRDRSKWSHPIQPPRSLICRICNLEAQTLEELHEHARSHHPGPTSVREPKQQGAHSHGRRHY